MSEKLGPPPAPHYGPAKGLAVDVVAPPVFPQQPGLIDHVPRSEPVDVPQAPPLFPRAHERVERYTLEKVPQHYHNRLRTPGFETAGPELTMIENFRNNLMFGTKTEDILGDAFAIVRSIADVSLYDLATPAVGDLLDLTRIQARPKHFGFLTEADKRAGAHGEYMDHSLMSKNRLWINKDNLQATSTNRAEWMEYLGTPLNNETDAYLLSVLHVTAHEAGHGILSGVSQLLKSEKLTVENTRNAATRAILETHPENGLTGNWDSDVRIHEERFAEGYALMFTNIAMQAMGYDKATVTNFMSRLMPGGSLDEVEKGKHQLDQLELVDAYTDVNAAMLKAGFSKEEVTALGQDNMGVIGYLTALTRDEIMQQLENLMEIVQNGERLEDFPFPQEWTMAVEAQQSETVKAHLATLHERRTLQEMAPKKRRLGKTALKGIFTRKK
jgi:hypothetical protein